MSTALTTSRNGLQTVSDARKRDELLRHLILPKATPEQLELVLAICERYQFDPLLRHVLIINQNIYVTRDGLRHMAWQSGEFDGYDPPEERQDAQGKWIVTVKVWRKGIARPFVATAYQAEAENTQSPVWRSHPRLMTGKVAEVIALRMAFGVSLGGAEEIGFEDGSRQTNIGEARFVEAREVPPAALPAPAFDFASWSARLQSDADNGIATGAIAAEIKGNWGLLDDGQAEAIDLWFRQLRATRKAARATDEALLAAVVNAGETEERRAGAARAFLGKAADAERLTERVAQLTVLDFPAPILDVLVAEQRERLGLPDDDAGDVIEATDDPSTGVPF